MKTQKTRAIRRGLARGFSLLELTLVLAIIGLLMAGAAISFLGAGERSRVRITKTTLGTIKGQIDSYYINNSVYPPDLTTLVTAKYLEEGKINDAWKQPLYYATPGMNGRPYDLMSLGADKTPGTPDDIDVWTMDTTQE